jgi:hypothetical protein
MRRLLQQLFFTIFLLLPARASWGDGPSMSEAEPTRLSQVHPMPELGDGWQSIETIYARVHHRSEDTAVARQLSAHAEVSIPRLSKELALPTGGVMDIVISPDTEHFRATQPGTPPQWADATAWPQSSLVFLRSPRDRGGQARPLTQVLDHEVVHVVLGKAFAPQQVPRWLQEGTAQLLAKEYTAELTKQLAAGLLGDNLLELQDLTTGFPQSPARARLAYAQSADFMAHIRADYGEEAFQNLIQQLAQGRPTDAAIRLATGRSVAEVDEEWRDRLESGPLWLQAVVNDSSLLAMAGLLFALGYWRFRARKIAVLKEWEREEEAQDALYAQMAEYWDSDRSQVIDIEASVSESEGSGGDSGPRVYPQSPPEFPQ